MALPSSILQRGLRSAQPAATAVAVGVTYYVTDELVTEQSNGTIWEPYSAAGAGTGDVSGPASSVDKEIALFDSTSGKLLERATGTGIVRVTSGVYGTPGNVVESEITLADNTTNDVSTTKHGFAPKAPNDATKYLDGTGAYSVPAGGSGACVQIVNTQTGAVATGSTLMPFDDTIPQNSEGDEYMTLAITPTDAANTLKIDVVWYGASSQTNWITVALFQDSTAGALAAFANYQNTGGGFNGSVFTHYMVAGTTSATTFKVRAGRDASAAGTVSFNGQGGSRRFGGVLASSITITEYVP